MVTSVFPRFAGDATPAFVQSQALALAAVGWKVTVLAPHGTGARFREWIPVCSGEASSGIEVIRFPYAWPFGLQKLCYDGGMLVNFRTRPWTKALLPLFIAAQFLVLLWLTLRCRPQILHSHSLLPQGFTAGLVAMVTHTPHITTSHGNDVFGLRPDGLMGRLKRWVLGQADAVTVNSSATEAAVRDLLGGDPAKVHRVPATPNAHPADPDRVAEIRARHVGAARPVILFAGRMIADKGVGDLIDALAHLRSDFPDLRALFIGDGQDRAVFETQVQRLGLEDRVCWAGWVPPETITSWMAAGDVFVLPSKVFEAQGLVLVEAMLTGVPIVASRIGGIPDMIEDKVTGRLVPPGNCTALAATLTEVLRNPATRSRLAANARERAQSSFSPAAVTAATEAVYRAIAP